MNFVYKKTASLLCHLGDAFTNAGTFLRAKSSKLLIWTVTGTKQEEYKMIFKWAQQSGMSKEDVRAVPPPKQGCEAQTGCFRRKGCMDDEKAGE